MLDRHVRQRLERREELLSPYAAKARASKGRAIPEEPSPLRTDFQRDRDRIIHSKAFRRLKHKTQVFIAPQGDHYVTRLTHTLEVSQIARTIARALDLNEDLEEAITLGHDLGHTPFGHIGEETLDALAPGGFRHAQQSLRVVDVLEKDGAGLNLTWEVRQGIAGHSKPQGDFLDGGLVDGLTLEAQVCRLADAVAYLNHDIGDAIRAGLLREDDLPAEVTRPLGSRHSQRIDTMVADVVEASWACTGQGVARPHLSPPPQGGRMSEGGPLITMSEPVREALNVLRAFMFERVYLPSNNNPQGRKAREIVTFLYSHYAANPDHVPQEYWKREEPPEQMAVDYISSMTDQFALRRAEELRPGISGGMFDWVV
ncbi:MAG: deoxyguanosinetriphosphate triphosphohydrolase [Chloroflexi bacterium]|nr:deoxyguanosinetriphosphate triphosphohydrolase [Chloroflexota bacterium]